MRIQGMDAQLQQVSDTQNAKQVVKDTPDVVHKTTTIPENKMLSQISEYERNELPVSEKVVIEAIERANRVIMGANRRFEFSIHEQTKQIMVKVIDSETNETVREIPPEKILDMVAKMWEMAGIIVDERR